MANDKIVNGGFYFIFVINVMLMILLFSLLFFNEYEFCSEIKFIDIISILTTLLCSIFITYFISKTLSAERYKKELYISDLLKIEGYITSVIDDIRSPSTNDTTQILASISKIQSLISRFEIIVNLNKISINQIKDAFQDFYSVATNFEQYNSLSSIDFNELQNTGNKLILELRKKILSLNEI